MYALCIVCVSRTMCGKRPIPHWRSLLRIRRNIPKTAHSAQLLVTIPTSVWIASFCGGVWFPKADLAQVPRGQSRTSATMDSR